LGEDRLPAERLDSRPLPRPERGARRLVLQHLSVGGRSGALPEGGASPGGGIVAFASSAAQAARLSRLNSSPSACSASYSRGCAAGSRIRRLSRRRSLRRLS